ncbi:MAG TPA: hypothetical protein VLA89_15865 [Gemmatimonadales bacterium]|nr:hypothetical protein [Gemmatimonadales bacterium]
MRRAALFFSLLVLISASLPGLASAAITVSLSDGTTTKTSLTGFALSVASVAPANTTLNILTSCTAPCTRFFPSGGLTQGAGDTFKIQDVSSTNRARVEKIDVPSGGTATTGADSFVVRGIKITALTSTARTFTMTYNTASGDFSTISSTSGNYAGTAKLKGQFRLGTGAAIAATCTSVDTPCAQLSVKINLLTLNGTGSNLSTLITASIPCSTVSGTASPCGSGGFYSPTLAAGDQFLASDTGTVGCGLTCAPFWQSTLKVKFNAANQIFTLTTSAATAVAPNTPQGLVDIALALAEPGVDVWVGVCGGVSTGTQPYRVTGLTPFGNLGRNQNNNANFPMKFSLEVGELIGVTGGFPHFVSIDDQSELTLLPPADRFSNDVCSMSWVPSTTTRPKFSTLSALTLNFSQFDSSTADSGDSRLGSLIFSDCTACFRVEIDLVDADGVSQVGPPNGLDGIPGTADDGKPLTVYLGNDSTTSFQTKYTDYSNTTSLALVSDGNLRVDGQGMANPTPCCISFADAKKNNPYGKLFVRSITVVMDKGKVLGGSHQVEDLEAIVNHPGLVAASSSNDSMQTIGNFQPSCDWPPVDGLKIAIYRVKDALGNPTFQFVQNVLNPTISSCTLTATVNTTNPPFGVGTYEAHVVGFSAADKTNVEFVGGIDFPNPGIMLLK